MSSLNKKRELRLAKSSLSAASPFSFMRKVKSHDIQPDRLCLALHQQHRLLPGTPEHPQGKLLPVGEGFGAEAEELAIHGGVDIDH